MKKNKMLRAASVLLILVMLTTSIVGGTFAKYTTTGKASDTARVAKWGVVITTSGALYSDAYAVATAGADGADGNLPVAWANTTDATKVTVATATDDNENIVAPGTKSYGEGLSFGMSGKPEVAAELKATIKAEDIYLKAGTYGVMVKASVSDLTSLKKVMGTGDSAVDVYKATTADGTTTYAKVDSANPTYDTDATYYVLTNKVKVDNDYYPVAYTLTGSTKNDGTTDSTTADGVASKLAKALNGSDVTATATAGVNTYSVTRTLPANTDLGGTDTGALGFKDENLTWEWKFENPNMDSADTLLGDMIAARGLTGADAPAHKFVAITPAVDATPESVTELVIKSGTDDYTVTAGAGSDVVANLHTQFDISLTVTQVD